MTATLVVNLDTGNYSPELGTAERMPNGNYVFDSGSQGGGLFGQSIEMLPGSRTAPAFPLNSLPHCGGSPTRRTRAAKRGSERRPSSMGSSFRYGM
jgi:hypothetical protein